MLAEWQATVDAHSWSDAYVFFKHDYIDGAGPLAVERFTAMVGAATGGVRASEGTIAYCVVTNVNALGEKGCLPL
jgi:hypothetical protein